jgi:beta-glucanase (GH16 family)
VRKATLHGFVLLALAACGLAPPETGEPPAPADAPPPPPPANVGPVPPGARVLVWSDEFDGTALDPARWRVWSGARRDAVVAPEAISVAGGVLRVTTFTEGGVHRTGFLGTDGRFAATYGYFEARIRFHGAPGQWCAFWLFSPTIGEPVGDPAAAGAEIDVIEHRVTDDGGWQLADHVAMNVHWDGYGPERKNTQRVTQLPGGGAVNGVWHTYAVLWNEREYTFYVDDVPIWRTSQGLSGTDEWLHLTCEVEDASWAGFVPGGGYGAREASTTGMEVDWVRAWELAP